jgi:hypothetical protein
MDIADALMELTDDELSEVEVIRPDGTTYRAFKEYNPVRRVGKDGTPRI